ncbi:DEAD/DEAH box helicase [delta proteobacterium NaphS2]|nr:DEAD/DEAH box helicase [delta proteobacterium NaphS2]
MTNHVRHADTIKRLLPQAWYAFLGRFPALTPIQRAAIPVILEGHNALLMAPTAGGKTESFAAPLAERIQGDAEHRTLSAWIVSPTRALVNDLFRRLKPPLERMGLRPGRRTGDHREISGREPPHMVVTTPESLDSILTRNPAMLKEARFMVLDEIHMLDHTARGDQLACLVSRAGRISNNLQVIASSATIADPRSLALRYLGPGHKTVEASGGRNIEAEFVEGGAGDLHKALKAVCIGDSGARKVLAFVKRRADAETFCRIFKRRPPFGDAVFLHHGSLSRSHREMVEKRMLTGTAGLCFATSTLEVGIDIGDIDLIVLMNPPGDVPSLLQRMGRGNRRTGTTRVLCWCRQPGEMTMYRHLLECAASGRLLSGSYPFIPSVLAQQCLSLLMQSPGRWISAEALASRMPPWLGKTEWTGRLSELMDHLAEKGWMQVQRNRYVMGDRLEDAFTRGLIHSNIADEAQEVQVVDQDTRRILGTLPKSAAESGHVMLSGRHLEISGTAGTDQLLVRDSKIKSDLSIHRTRGPVIETALARDFARFLGIPPGTAPLLRLEDGLWGLFHFMGSLWGVLLSLVMARLDNMEVTTVNGYFLLLTQPLNKLPQKLRRSEIRNIILRHRRKLRYRIQEGGWASQIPASWRDAHLLACVDVDRFTEAVQSMRVDENIQPEQKMRLVELVKAVV